MSTLHRIDDSLLRNLAGETAFMRGSQYAKDEAVVIEQHAPERVVACVRGTHRYSVTLWWEHDELEGRCSCPVGERDEFCKHQVATALAWAEATAGNDDAAATPKAPRKGKTRSRNAPGDADDIVMRRWLTTLGPEALHALVIELAGRDRDGWRAMVARARFACTPPDTLRKAVGELIGRKRFLDYRASLAYARRLQPLCDSLGSLSSRDPAAALDLAGYALQRLFPIYGESDDSAGAIGDVLAGIGKLYRMSASMASPAPETFAKNWLKLRLADEWRVLGDVDDYVDVLGGKGLAWLERQVSARLDALPAASSLQRWGPQASERRSLQHILESLARHGGDVDAMLARRAQSLDRPWDWLELAQLCDRHDRPRLALQWLERGLKAFPDDLRLLEALSERRMAEGFADEALPLCWRAFQEASEEAQYLRLLEAASNAGQRDHWRERALTHVRKRHAQADDTIVRLHLAEHDIDKALAIAEHARLPLSTWARLAATIEHTHPDIALRAFRTLVQGCVERTSRQSYLEAMAWIRRMPPLHRQLGSEAQFTNYLDTLRVTYRAKKSFVAMLEEVEA